MTSTDMNPLAAQGADPAPLRAVHTANCFGIRDQQRRRQRTGGGRRWRLRPAVMALEGRALLSTLTVSSINDTGGGSLRAAIGQANADGGGDTIVFSSMFNSAQRITLTSGELQLSGGATTTIQGPGANLLTVSGGGASRVFDVESGSLSLSGMRITGGRSNFGGGVYSHDSTLMLANVTISGNSPADSSRGSSGGGLACRGDASTNTNTAILTNCTMSGNFGTLGAGIYNEMYSSLTMTDCTLSNNYGADLGGGLLNEGTATLVGCTISGNSAKKTSPNPGQGGGVDNGGTMTLTNCTVGGNYAYFSGGGVDNGGSANTLTLTNCTVSGNSSGGGVSGVVNDANLTMNNTIVSDNTYGDVLGSYSGGNNLVGENALLAPLGNYGGPTQTVALLPGSPAIGAGASGAGIPVIDQRGEPRAGLVDIGAFQSQGFTLTLASSSAFLSATINTSFASPLAVTVTAVNSVEPVNGGVVSFAVTPVGSASATLSAATATITARRPALRPQPTPPSGSTSSPRRPPGPDRSDSFSPTTSHLALGCQHPSRQLHSRQLHSRQLHSRQPPSLWPSSSMTWPAFVRPSRMPTATPVPTPSPSSRPPQVRRGGPSS